MSPGVESESIVSIHAMTDVGRSRTHNEDNFIVCPDLLEKRWYISDKPEKLSECGCLLVVADGMGGANAGEIASKIAVETVQRKFDSLQMEGDLGEQQAKDYLYQAIMEAHKAIVDASGQNPEYQGMGATILIAWVFSAKAVIGWCGDSRAYLYRENSGIQYLTKDHSLVWDLVEAGRLTPDEADVHPDNNIITQSLGDRVNPQPDFAVFSLQEKDRLLLCSDGLNNMLNQQAIEAILEENLFIADANFKLIQAANEKGGADNITVLSLDVLRLPVKNQQTNYPWRLAGAVLFILLLGTLAFVMFSPSAIMGTQTYAVVEKSSSLIEPSVPEPANASTNPVHTQAQPTSGEVGKKLPGKDSMLMEEQPLVAEEDIAYASAVGPLLVKYHYLDSLLILRLLTENFEGEEQDSLIMTKKTGEPEGGTEQELMDLLKKYELGYTKEYGNQEGVLDSLSKKHHLTLQDISMDLSRIEYLLHQKNIP